jgi:hypothetical protein
MEPQQLPSRTGVAPLSFAIGIVVSLVGLIVNPLVITPLGGAITLLAAIAWTRRGRQAHVATDEPFSPEPVTTAEAPYTRSRLLERATLALGGLALKGAGEPATGPESWLYPLDPS